MIRRDRLTGARKGRRRSWKKPFVETLEERRLLFSPHDVFEIVGGDQPPPAENVAEAGENANFPIALQGGLGRDEFDWGDAPDSFAGVLSYRTLAINSGAVHRIDGVHFLGRAVDPEADGQPIIGADGDDVAGPALDDEDGIRFLTPLIPGQTAEVQVIASTDGYLNAWVDSDRSGTWDVADNVFAAQPVSAGVNILTFNVPAAAQVGPTYSRWRFTDQRLPLDPFGGGIAGSQPTRGEVEDYRLAIEERGSMGCIDFEDLIVGTQYFVGDVFIADATGLQATLTGEPFNYVAGGTTSRGYARVDNGGQAGHLGQDVNLNNVLLDFNFGDLLGGLSLNFGEYGGDLNLEINGDLRKFLNYQDVDGLVIGGVKVQVPTGGAGDDTGELIADGPIHTFKVGGQELWIDHFCVQDAAGEDEFDWGDAPDLAGGPAYQTLAVNNGAVHRINGVHFLGDAVDAEPNGQPNGAADGDDVAGPAVDDEDGIQFLTPLVPGQLAEVQVTASEDGFLNAWVDFGGDGTWGAVDNVLSAQFVFAGSQVLTFNVPVSANAGTTYSRWRFTDVESPLDPFGGGMTGVQRVAGEVEDHRLRIEEAPQDRLDWGDAPDFIGGAFSYRTLAASDGARHIIVPEFFLGAQIDAEPNGQPSVDAKRDDLNGVDDEDGVQFLSLLVPSQPATLEVTASGDGHLDAWIDFDQNGVFDAGDQVFTKEPLAAGPNLLKFVVPNNALPTRQDATYARFRFSQAGGLQPFGLARNGEVEDYAVRIQRATVPPVVVPTPWHWMLEVVPVNQDNPVLWDFVGLGEIAFHAPVNLNSGDTFSLFTIGADGMTQPNAVPEGEPWLIQYELVSLDLHSTHAEASADNMHLILRDADSPLQAGPSAGQMVVVNDGEEMFFDSFFDVYTEITFADTQMAIGNSEAIRIQSAGSSLPPLAPDEVTRIPVHFWQEGLANELVEIQRPHPLWDVLVAIHGDPARAFDWGDAPDNPYPTLAVNNGAVHQIRRGVRLGQRLDGEFDGQPTPAAEGDDMNPAITVDDEDGVQFVTPLIPGSPATVRVNASTDGWLNAWIDFDGNGVWDAGLPENIFSAQPLVAGNNLLNFAVPAGAVADPDRPTLSRWRFSTTHQLLTPEGAAPTGAAARRVPDGEVEDHPVLLRPRDPADQLDYGDAPDEPYPTLLVSDGARHTVDREFFLGNTIDVDPDGTPTVAANGDDVNDGNDDEDGVTFRTPLVPGQVARIEVIASQDGLLDAWIDFDRDGKWQPSEQIATLLPLNAGVNFHSFPVPAWAAPTGDTPTYARFRLSRNGVPGPQGPAPDGEVEDYTVTIEERDAQGPSQPVVELRDSGLSGLAGTIQLPDANYVRVTEPDDLGRDWVQMLVPGVESVLGAFGMPAIPVYRTMIGIPKDSQVSINVQAEPYLPMQLDLYPFQQTGLDGDDPDEPPAPEFFADPPGFDIDPKIYDTDAFYPRQLASVRPLGMLRDLEVALVEIATAQYNPVARTLRPFTSFDFEISFAGGQSGFLPENARNPFENASPHYEGVLNADALEEYYPGSVATLLGEEYLILTHPDFRDAADTLAAWKNTKGIMTSVFEVGQGTVRETKEEIHDFIQGRWDNNIVRPSYVLFLGDTEFVPTWYRSTYYAGGDGGPRRDMDQDDNQGEWVSLGTANFLDSGGEYVELVRKVRDEDLTDTGATVADAVKFVNVDTSAEVIVDNLDAGFSIESGSWTESGAVDEFDGSSIYTRDDEATVRFTPSLPGEGLYEVWAWWSGEAGFGGSYPRDSEARYKIISANTGTDTPYAYVAGGLFNILPDLANGRIPVDTLDQAMDVVDKIIAYEQSPPGSLFDSSFYNNASLASQFQGYRDGSPTGRDNRAFLEESERTRDTLMSAGKTVERIYTKTEDAGETAQEPNRYYGGDLLPNDLRISSGFPWDGDTTDILNAFDDGRFLMVHRDHGWPGGWAHPGFSSSSISSLNNGDLTPFVYSINCASGVFDNESSGSLTGTSTSGSYFSERLLREPNGGAVVVVGDTRNSNTWSNTAFYRGLIDATWTNNDSSYGSSTSIKRVGDIVNYAKEYTLAEIGAPAAGTGSGTPDVGAGFAVDTLYLYHVLGDPTLEMWTSNPHIFVLPLDIVVAEVTPRKLELEYAVSGATITAYQQSGDELVPLGRGVVEDGLVELDLIADADLSQPIQFAASAPDAVSQQLVTALDFGDAPERPYPTTLANDGVRDAIREGFYLGARVDAETDGQPHPLALGDDLGDSADEDGVTFSGYIIADQTATMQIVASADGLLDIWLDLDQDGVWETREQIFANEPVAAGSNGLSFSVPADANPVSEQAMYMRVRFSSNGGLSPLGFARDGEVEDYAQLRGDLNGDGAIDADDIDELSAAVRAGNTDSWFDLNGDQRVDNDDRVEWVEQIRDTMFGDSDLNHQVDAVDFGAWNQNRFQQDTGWARADFNGDGLTDGADFNVWNDNRFRVQPAQVGRDDQHPPRIPRAPLEVRLPSDSILPTEAQRLRRVRRLPAAVFIETIAVDERLVNTDRRPDLFSPARSYTRLVDDAFDGRFESRQLRRHRLRFHWQSTVSAATSWRDPSEVSDRDAVFAHLDDASEFLHPGLL